MIYLSHSDRDLEQVRQISNEVERRAHTRLRILHQMPGGRRRPSGRTHPRGNPRLGVRRLKMYDATMSNENLLSRISVDPEICHGKPCVRGLRYPVETILEYLAGGDSIEDLLAEFPDLEREDILACHEFSRRMLAAKSMHLALT